MKPFIKNKPSLVYFQFCSCISPYPIILSLLSIKYPLIGIEVKEKNNHWMVEKIYEKGWAYDQPIEEGDIVKLVNRG